MRCLCPIQGKYTLMVAEPVTMRDYNRLSKRQQMEKATERSNRLRFFDEAGIPLCFDRRGILG